MAFPLSNRTINTVNTISSPVQHSTYEDKGSMSTGSGTDNHSPASSPFVENVFEGSDRENMSPSKPPKATHKGPSKSISSSDKVSPLRMFKSRPTSLIVDTSTNPSDALRTPRKLSDKRFPVRPSISPAKSTVVCNEKTVDIDDLRDNEGLTKAIQILEDDSEVDDTHSETDETLLSMEMEGPGVGDREGTPNFDDTMVSAFSDFSAVPDMTMFAKIGHSPSKYSNTVGPTPRRAPALHLTSGTARRTVNAGTPSATPRAATMGRGDDTTNLLDFTEQINGFTGASHPTPNRHARFSPMKSSMPDVTSYFGSASPSVNRNQMSNLLDFDIPPAPTPRSMPSITPRELESLKSSFLSEISSLKATLSGKEAEVHALKTAVGDAEKRVGESLEQVREEKNIKEQLAAEKEEWQNRGREMEAVLRNVKEEIVHGERDREDLEGRLEESERRREAAEMMAQEAESKMAAVRAGKGSPSTPTSEEKPSGDCSCGGARTVEIAVEKVSRELHTLYKEKHETKVSALKKSYERRWDKKIRELEDKVEDLTRENDELRRDATMTKMDSKSMLESPELLEQQAAREARTTELEAELEGLSEVVRSVQEDNADLRQLLDEERVEKSKLVAAVDEMIPLVAAFDDMLADMNSKPQTSPVATPVKRSQSDNHRMSITRTSGLRAPKSVSGIPSGNSFAHKRVPSTEGNMRPGSGAGYRSGIMSSIEKMGSYKGRAE